MELIPWSRKRQSGSESETNTLARLRDDLDRMFESPFELGLRNWVRSPETLMPQLDVTESDNDVTVRAEIPGINPEDVRIEVTGRTLLLSGEKTAEHEDKSAGYCYSERQFGRFSRRLALPTQVDADKVDARYRNGVLTIMLPKHPEAQPKRVTVRNA